jgi:hypothetical protein
MTSLNLPELASILVGADPTGPYNEETQFVRGEEIGVLCQTLLDKYGEDSAIGKALQARDAAALGSALSQAKPPFDSDPECVRMAQDLLR